MIPKIVALLRKSLYALFLLTLGLCLIAILLTNRRTPLIYYPTCALTLGGLVALHGFLRRREGALRRMYPYLLCGLLLLAVAQILLGTRLATDPFADFGHVYHGAVEWATRGSFALDPERADYFCLFPNTLGLTTVLAALFWVLNKLGIQDFFLAAMVLNSLLATATVLLCADILRRMVGYAAVFVGAAMFLILPPFYLLGAAFYSDAMSMIFPALFLWLYLVGRELPLRRRWPLDLLMAVVAFAGFKIKATPLILAIAVWMIALMQRRTRLVVAQVIAAVCVFVLFGFAWQIAVVGRYLPRETLQANRLPWTTWLALGVSDQHSHDAIREVLDAGDTPAERNRAAWRAVMSRIQDKAKRGTLLRFFADKMAEQVGGGTMGLADLLDDRPLVVTRLHDVVLYGAPHYPAYDAYCSGVQLALWLLAFWAGIAGLRRRDSAAARHPEPLLALLGVLLFLFAWEARDRYFANYVPVLILAATLGICSPMGWRRGAVASVYASAAANPPDATAPDPCSPDPTAPSR